MGKCWPGLRKKKKKCLVRQVKSLNFMLFPHTQRFPDGGVIKANVSIEHCKNSPGGNCSEQGKKNTPQIS